MTITVICPACQHTGRVPEGSQGRRVRCRGCKTLFGIPAGSEGSGPRRALITLHRPASRPLPSVPTLAAVVVIALGLAAGGAAAWLVMRGEDGAPAAQPKNTEPTPRVTQVAHPQKLLVSLTPKSPVATPAPQEKEPAKEVSRTEGPTPKPAPSPVGPAPQPSAPAVEVPAPQEPPVELPPALEIPAAPRKQPPPPDKEAPSSPAAEPQGPILLPAARLAALRQKAATNAPEWRAFKARLDKHLPQIIRDCYQGSQLAWISDYALGYLVLKERDPATAARYADKAIAFLKSGLYDCQKGGSEARQFLARGDGSTRTFILPHAGAFPATVRCYLGKVKSIPVKRQKTPQDTVGYYYRYLKVSDTADGPARYEKGVDWEHNPNLANNLIDWSLPGKKPAPGSTYYVTVTSRLEASPVRCAVSGNRITLAPAPRPDQALFVEYIYSQDGLNYQQTSAGDGGFNSILIDTTYPSRYLGKHIAMGLDWLDGYPRFAPALKDEATAMLVRWSDYLRDHGYLKNSPASNYDAGAYVSRVMTALALARRHPEGPRLMSEVVEYRQKYLVPTLQNKDASLKGGFWPEGWSYGQLAAENLILAGLAMEEQGLIPAANAERRWASDVVRHLVSAQSSRQTIYDGGDWFAYPAPFPGKELITVLAACASDGPARSHANYILQNYPGPHADNYVDLLLRQPSAPASFWDALPLQHFAEGTGLLTARSDWRASPTWVSFQLGNLLNADHQSYIPGQVQIKRGADDLLINGNAPGKNQAGVRKSTYGNVIVVDDNGEKLQVYRHSMGLWYGKPGVAVTAYEASEGQVYVAGDYRAAYSLNTKPGNGGPVRELTRQVVYLRPSVVVVYDKVETVKDSYTKELRWHFLKVPALDGTSFTAAAGGSKLFGQTFASVPLQAKLTAVKVGGASVQQLGIHPAAPVKRVCYVSVFQAAPSTESTPAACRRVASADATREGAQVGNHLVLFGRGRQPAPPSPVRYEVSGSGPIHHFLTDLPPGRRYAVQAGGEARAPITVSPQGTLSFTTSANGEQTVVVAPVP
jgi:hypothetical protein